jgi:putative CocE/NonD family hydrolase
VYDPLHPVSYTVELDCWAIAAQRLDRRDVESRPDVLCYTSAPLQTPIEISGPIAVQLCGASSAIDTDFTVTLVDVYPDGSCDSIQDGILRTSHRDSDSKPSPIEPDRIYAFQIDLWSISYVVKAGHRLRVGRAAKPVAANQTIYHTREWPSFVEMFIAE